MLPNPYVKVQRFELGISSTNSWRNEQHPVQLKVCRLRRLGIDATPKALTRPVIRGERPKGGL